MAYPLHFPEKAPKGTKQGAKLPEALTQGRESGVFLAFSRFPSVVKRIEQDLRRRMLYPAELRAHMGTCALYRKIPVLSIPKSAVILRRRRCIIGCFADPHIRAACGGPPSPQGEGFGAETIPGKNNRVTKRNSRRAQCQPAQRADVVIGPYGEKGTIPGGAGQ